MKKGLFILGGLLATISLCSCDKQVETRVEYVDRVMEVEKPVEVTKEVEVIKEVPVETTVYVDREVVVEKEVEKTVTVEVPVEKIVEVEKIIEKEIPIEIEKIVTETIKVEVPVEKVVEVEKIIEVEKIVEKEVVVERYNDYYEKLVDALSNAVYCDDSNYHITTVGWTVPYLAVYCQGLSGTTNPVVGCGWQGYAETGYTYSWLHAINKVSHDQICAIKRSDSEIYEDYLPKPLYKGTPTMYDNKGNIISKGSSDIYGPSEQYKHTLGEQLGMHVLTNVKVECVSDKTAINYNNVPAKRTVISYEDDYFFGEFYGGILEELRLANREINLSDYYHYNTKLEVGDEATVLGSAIKVKYPSVAYKSGLDSYYNCEAHVTVGEDDIIVAKWIAKLNSGSCEWEGNKLVTIRLTEAGIGEITNIQEYARVEFKHGSINPTYSYHYFILK